MRDHDKDQVLEAQDANATTTSAGDSDFHAILSSFLFWFVICTFVTERITVLVEFERNGVMQV